MKKIIILFLLFPCVGFTFVMKGVFGTDDRVETHDYHSRSIQKLARSVAVQMDEIDLEENGRRYDLWQLTLADKVEVCQDERFSEQLAIGQCSGFLIAPDLIVTAGHCVNKESKCKKRKWVFDYTTKVLNKNKGIKKKNVYGCEKVIKSAFDFERNIDFAIVKLDRQVQGRKPLKYRTRGSINIGEDVLTIGYPSGIPQKVSGNATVMKSTNINIFKTDLDTFIGNSGSPVFNTRTNEVEGIVVRGGKDYYFPEGLDCKKIFKCRVIGGKDCPGEDVQKIKHILPYI